MNNVGSRANLDITLNKDKTVPSNSNGEATMTYSITCLRVRSGGRYIFTSGTGRSGHAVSAICSALIIRTGLNTWTCRVHTCVADAQKQRHAIG
jgi:D-arabinose 5-phosphate isomerase GutQ